MERLDDRLTIVLLSMVLGMTILSVLCYATIFVQPDIPFNPLSPRRATDIAATAIAKLPTSTPIPIEKPDQSYPPTWTPSPTRTPGPTKTATDTRTPTPTKTATPTRTHTPTRTPTFTPIPPPPTITPTPLPPPYRVASHSSKNNCADIGLEGVVNGSNGLPLAGVQLQFGEIGISGSRFLATTDNNGRYGALLIPGTNESSAKRSHNWYSYVLENGQPASETFQFTTDPIRANNPDYCYDEEDDDTDNNDETLPAGCTLDPCQNSNSVQVKVVNWQMVTN